MNKPIFRAPRKTVKVSGKKVARAGKAAGGGGNKGFAAAQAAMESND